MPSNVVRRGDGFGARVTIDGSQMWLGTFASPELARAAIVRARDAPRPKRRRPRRVQPPTAAQVGMLADAMPYAALRVFVLTSAYSGLRLSETAAVEVRDLRDGRLHVRCGKGGKERHSVLFEPGLGALLEVLPPAGLVFRNRIGRRFDRKSVNREWVKARRAVDLEHFNFHDLRRFHATWLLDRGVSDMDVAVQLGHVDALGRPDPELVRRVYGFPSLDEALARVAGAA